MKKLKQLFKFFTQRNKLLHLIDGFMMQGCFTLLFGSHWALGISLFIGLAKEIYDLISVKNKSEMGDVIATWVGTLIFYIFFILLT